MRNFLIGGALVFVAACNPMAQIGSADTEIDEFHQRFNAEDFDAIWNDASQDFKEATPRAEFERFMNQMRASVGTIDDKSRTGFNVNTNNGVTSTSINLETTYENGEGTETFIFVGPPEDLQLLNWNIDTNAPWAEPEGDAAVRKPGADVEGETLDEKPQ